MRLNSKILLSFMPGIILASGVIVCIVIPTLESALRKSWVDNKVLLLEQNLNTIDRLMNAKYNDIQLLSSVSIFRDCLRGGMCGAIGARKIDEWMALSGPWDVLMVIDLNGLIRLSNDKDLISQRLDGGSEDTRAFQQAMKGSVYYSDVVYSTRSRQATVVFAAPIVAEAESNRPIKGVVLGHLTWTVVQEIMEDAASEQSRGRLLNKNGALIATDNTKERAAIMRPAGNSFEIVRRVLAGTHGVVAIPISAGEPVKLLVYATQAGYLNYKGHGWTMTSEVPKSTAFGSIKRFIRNLIVILSLGISLSFLTTVAVVILTISRPVASLTSVVRDITRGDSSRRVPVLSQDEIGELSGAFNSMLNDLNRSTVSKDFFNDILNSIQDQVIVTDAQGVIVLINPAVVKLLGFSKEELLGRPGADLLDGHEVSFLTPSQSAAAWLLRKSGEKVSVLFSASAITANDGRITGYIGAAKDVSDLRRLEARMHQSEKLSAVGQLAAGVAHEINNPLGVILGFAQGMARLLTPGDEHEMPIKSIEREALRCKALVQNLLTFARTSQSERSPTDVNATVEQALALISPQAKINQVAVSTRLQKGLPPILGNKNQLEQVIINLAKNAIDAMPNGGSLTMITELLEEAPHSWVCLRFIDDGTGIPPAIVSKIFDPFFTTKLLGQGTGLGLSLVSEIIQKHSGEITVESRPGRTEFIVKLPVRTGQELERSIEAIRSERLVATSETRFKGSISHG